MCSTRIPTNSRGLVGDPEPVAGIAGAGRQQRDAFRRQPRQREQLVDRRHYFLRRRGQHADRAAGQLYRVVPGSARSTCRTTPRNLPSIGQVTIISKSGTNQLHGAVFDYYSTPWFRAKGFFASSRATGIRHAPGILGRAARFAFRSSTTARTGRSSSYSYETSRGSATRRTLTPTVAPAAGGPETSPSPGWSHHRSVQHGAPFPDNIIPDSRINPVS